MANTIKLKRSSVADKAPVATDLEVGEVAVNTADALLYTKHSDGTVKTLVTHGSDGTDGTDASVTKANVEAVLTGAITSHTHSYLPLAGGTLTGQLALSGFSTTGGQNRNGAIYIGREGGSQDSEYFTMGWKNVCRSGEKWHTLGDKGFYIEAGSSEAGGIALDQDGVHIYGSGDTGGNFRIIDKDTDTVQFKVNQGTGDVYVKNKLVVGTSEVWHAGNDGSGSGLDADTVSGYSVAKSVPSNAVFTDNNTTYSNFSGTTAGLVPASTTTDDTKFLRADGTWVVPTDTTTNTWRSISDSTSSTSTTVSASSKAVKSAYDKGDHSHPYLPSTGGTLTGRLTLDENGYSLGSAEHKWTKDYVVNNANEKEILYHDGNSLPNGGVYRFTAHISGTGTDQFATAVYWNQNGTWRLNVTAQSGTSSNHPEFIISSTANKPTIHIDHPSNYTIKMLHERIELSEGTGTDNAGYAFGTDAFLGNTSGTLRYLSNGTSATGQGSYDDGNLVWHAGNDGSGSGLDADLLDGKHASDFSLAHSHPYLSTSGGTLTGNLKLNKADAKIILNDSSGSPVDQSIDIRGEAIDTYLPTGEGFAMVVEKGASNTAPQTKTAFIIKGNSYADSYKVGNTAVIETDAKIDANKIKNVPASWTTDTVYTHPPYTSRFFSIDTGALTGATVVSDIDISVAVNTKGHVTVASGAVSTRILTLGDLSANLRDLGDVSNGNGGSGWFNLGLGGSAVGGNTSGSLHAVTGAGNIGVSYYSLAGVTLGDYNCALGMATLMDTTTGSYNTAVGHGSGARNVVGNNNTFVGYKAGDKNIGNGNVMIGCDAGGESLANNKLFIANTITATPLIGGDFDAGTVTINGALTATGDITAYSDARIKENITEVPNALDAVDAIRGVTYTRTDTKEDSVGVIAQEVEALFPELVTEHEDGIKSVNYNGLVGVLFSAVKELSAEVKALKEQK